MPPKDKYTDPELRDQVKEELKESDKGGAPGQWSARKAQMMAQEYKRRGGDYTTDKSGKDESQQNLENWGKEDWQTKEGSGSAKKEDGTEKRYLPKKAWEQMSAKEKEETDQKKQEGSKEGKQYVDNTSKAKESRKKASKRQNGNKKDEKNGDDQMDEDEHDGDDDDEPDAAAKDDDEEEDFIDDGETDDDDEDDGQEDLEAEGKDAEDAETGDKRKRPQQSNNTSKKPKSNSTPKSKSNGKTFGSKHMSTDEPAPRGSADRLPKKGQQIHWKAMPGWVDGEVVEILTQGEKDVDGKSVKASQDDPKIVLKSNASGKICVHKPDACFFED